MSQLHIGTQLHLGQQELRRLLQFTHQDGLLRNLGLHTKTPGLLVDTGEEWRVSLDDSAQKTLRVAAGLAIDAGGRVLVHPGTQALPLPIPNTWYWLRARYQVRTLEEGTLTVSASGTITGQGTRFTQTLRGGLYHPSVLRLYAADGTPALLNGVSDHTVVDVLSDTELLVATQGLQNENQLRYAVVGAFAAGYVVPQDDAFPFRYDDCQLQLVAETTPGQAPALPAGQSAGDTFSLARVMRDAQTLYIEDKRTQLWQDRTAAERRRVHNQANPLLGVEHIRWNPPGSARDTNTVAVGWAFRASGWSLDAAAGQVTLSVGRGGCYLSTTDVQEGDFTGWRLYRRDKVDYLRIRACTKPTAATVRLTLERADPAFFNADSGDLVITPDCDSVVLKVGSGDGYTDLGENLHEFPVNSEVGRFDVLVPLADNLYQLRCAHRVAGQLTHYFLAPAKSQYYAENQHTSTGALLPSAQRTTARIASTFDVKRAPDSLSEFRDRIDSGDLLGVAYQSIEEATPVLTLTVGLDRQYQVLRPGVPGGTFAFSQNQVINLNTTLDDPNVPRPAGTNARPARNGNSFLLHLKGDFQPGQFTLTINQRYQDPASVGDVLRTLVTKDRQQARSAAGLLIVCTFDGSDWVVAPLGGQHEQPGTLKLLGRLGSYNPLGKFGNDGKGKDEWEGWALADGRNGTDDWRGMTPIGYDDRSEAAAAADSLGERDAASGNLVENYARLGNTGGAKQVVLTEAELASHTHEMEEAGEHAHTVDTYQVVRSGDNGTSRNVLDPGSPNGPQRYTTAKAGAHKHALHSTGGDKPHENRPRYRVAAWVQKIF